MAAAWRCMQALRLGDALYQVLTLQRRWHTLHRELRAAERALADEDKEADPAWLGRS